MKVFRSISFKIWIYFSAILLLILGLVIYYFPNQQKNAIEKYRGKELQELSRTIALGVELSLDVNDFQKLNKSIKYFQNKKQEFDFLVVLQQDDVLKSDSVFVKINDDPDFNFFALDTNLYLMKAEPFSSALMKGKVIIGLSKKRINEEVQKNNFPIYLVLFGIAILSIILFYIVAHAISSPINKAIDNARYLQNNQFNLFDIHPKNSKDEISQLQNALYSLKNSLETQKQENNNLLENLEYKIAERTEHLKETLTQLNDAQQIAMLGYYSFYLEKNKLLVSENLEAILETSITPLNTLDKLITIIDEEYINELEVNFKRQPISPFGIEVKTKLIDSLIQTPKWISITGRCFKEKETGNCYLSGTIQEITARKNAEAELQKLSLAVKSSFNSIIITDLDEKIRWVNDSVLKLTGYSREEIIGQSPKMFQFEETNSDTKKFIRENLQALKPFKTEIYNKSKSGRTYWLELYIQPILNKKGFPEGFMAIEIDITDRKEKEQLINRYIQEIELKQQEISNINAGLEMKVAEKTKDLELSILQIQKSQDEIIKKEKLATLGLLIAGIAHEINTPLGAIAASTDNLEYLFSNEFNTTLQTVTLTDLQLAMEIFSVLKQVQIPSTIIQRQHAKNLHENLNHLYPDLQNTFLISKELASLGFTHLTNEAKKIIENKNYIEVLKTIKLLSNIQRSLRTIHEGALKSSKIIKALNTYSHGSNQTEITQFDLKNNVENIITLFWNKIKYHATVKNNIPEAILLHGYEDELAQVWSNIINNALQASNNKCNITIDYTDDLNSHIISIQNDGPKIPDEVVDKIFDEFFTTKKRGEGTGLGLNIVKNIIEKHNGKITCTSSEKMTTFTITLPKQIIL